MTKTASNGNSLMRTHEGFVIPLAAMFQGILFNMVGTYAMFFYTDVIGFAPAAVGMLILIARIWDGVNDPIFGFIADRTRTRWGKFRPYLIFGPLFVSLFAVLMFTVPGLGTTEQFIYVCVVYVLFSMAYTVVDVPLWASPNVLTTDNLKITTVLSRVQLFATVGAIVASVMTMVLVNLLGGESMEAGFRNTAVVFGIFALLSTVLAGLAVRERVEPAGSKERVNLQNASKVVFQNKYTLIAMLSSVLILVTFTMKAITVPYYATYNLGNIDLVPLIMIAVSIPGMVGFIVAPRLVKTYGKKIPTIGSLVVAIFLSMVAYFVGYKHFEIILILQGLISFFMFIAMVITTTMFADSVTFADNKFGIRTEGIIFSFRTLSGKVAAALAAFFSGIILTLIGYIPDVIQTETALNGIHAIVTLYSAVIMVLCIIPVLFYDLTMEKIAEMTTCKEVDRI